MQEEYLIFAIISVIVIILISLFFVISNLQKTVIIKEIRNQKEEEERQKKASIEMMVELVAKRTISKNELTSAILEVAKNCPFPAKNNGVAPKNAKMYLNFILLVASHKNADAKLIAFMDEALKKTNPEYKSEIDIYENEGINQRGNRI
ncbi:MAG: hypothetical protein PHE60_03850 [Sulfurospirillaceae bacterium]|nr:hypothetical protein [Sulfurospirillaceae bacterium]